MPGLFDMQACLMILPLRRLRFNLQKRSYMSLKELCLCLYVETEKQREQIEKQPWTKTARSCFDQKVET